MSKPSAISHRSAMTLEAPDWNYLRSMSPEDSAPLVGHFLRDLDGVEKQVFALRGMAMLLVEERQLYRFVLDEEVGDYYQSFDRWMKQELPQSWGYCRDALRAVKELKDMPFEDMLQIKRCNLEQLKKVSSGVRLLPEVVKAAKTLPEKAFVEKMNADHDQHLSAKVPVVMADPPVSVMRDEAIGIAKLIFHVTNDGDALEIVYADFISAHREDAAIEAEQIA